MITLREAKIVGDRLHVNWKHINLREFRLGMSIEMVKHNFSRNGNMQLGKLALSHLKVKHDYYSSLKRMMKRR